MIANTRKMYELKLKIEELILRENVTSDMFNALVSKGTFRWNQMEEYVRLAKCPEKKSEIVRLSKEEIMKDPYLKNIVIEPTTIHNIRLNRGRKVLPNWLGFYKEEWRDLDTFELHNSYFVTNEKCAFPSIIEGDTNAVWMSVEPCEMESFREFVAYAKGNVLLGGCGLGYVAYLLSLKDDVKHITILELNPDIIQMFQENILPQFEQKDKISIVQTDAIAYLKTQNISDYQYVNVDIWKDSLDMLPLYLECLKVEFANPNVHFSYWLEPTLKTLIQKYILMDISHTVSDVYFLASQIGHDLVSQADINNRLDVQNLLSLPNMRKQLLDWYQSNFNKAQELKRQDEDVMEGLKKKRMF